MRRYIIVVLFLTLGFFTISTVRECSGEGAARVLFKKTVVTGNCVLIDKEGKETAKMWSDYLRRYDGYYILGQSGAVGLAKADGTKILQTQVTSITPFLKFGYACLGTVGAHNGAVWPDGRVRRFDGDLFRVLSNGSMYTLGKCLYDSKGNLLRDDAFVYTHNDYSEGLLSCILSDEKVRTFAYVDEKGEAVFTHTYERTGNFHEGLAWFEKDRRYGFMDTTGKIVIEPAFSLVGDFSEGLAAAKVEMSDLCGYIGRDSKYVIEPQFRWGEPFEQGTAVIEWLFEQQSYKALIDRKGSVINGHTFNGIDDFVCGIAQVNSGSEVGAINRQGKLLYAPKRMGEITINGIGGEYIVVGRKGHKGARVVQQNCKHLIVHRKEPGTWGLFTGNAAEILPPIYNMIAHLGGSMFSVQEGDSFFIYNAETGGKSVSVNGYINREDGVVSSTQGALSFVASPKTRGFVDFEGNVLLKAELEELGLYYDGLAPARQKNLWGYIDITGRWVIPPAFKKAQPFMDGYAAVIPENRIHLSDADGNLLLHSGYTEIRESRDERIAVRLLSFWGFLDNSLSEIVPPVYNEVTDYCGGVAAVKKGDKWGAVDLDGKLVLAIEHDEIVPLQNGYIPVKTKGMWGLADKTGSFVIPPIYSDIWRQQSSDGLVGICVDKKWGLVDLNGKMVLEPTWGHLEHLCKGYCIYASGTFYQGADHYPRGGIVSTDGRVITEARYNRIQPFSEGYALVATSNWEWGDHFQYEVCYWNYVDESGKLLLKDTVNWALPFKSGFAAIQANKEIGFIDKTGEYVNNARFEDVCWTGFPDRCFACAKHNGKWGLVNSNMTWLIKPFASEIHGFVGQLAFFKVKGREKEKTGYINANGEVLYYDLQGAFILKCGIAYVHDAEDKIFAIRNNGELLVEGNFKGGCPVSDRVMALRTDDKWHFLTEDGIFATANLNQWNGQQKDVMILH